MPSLNCTSRKLPLAFLGVSVLVVLSASVVAQTAFSNSMQETVLYSFGGLDGAGSLFGVIADANGNLYGTTVFGGPAKVGTVFKLVPNGSGYSESVLYAFKGGSDGSEPLGGLVADKHGALYGVTGFGGIKGCGGCGTVFKLTPRKSGYKFSVPYSFRGYPDVDSPVGTPVRDRSGAIYGVSQFGGSSGFGAVFKLTPGKSGYTESVLYSFAPPGGTGGYLPQAGLTIDNKGSLYGTTYYGGTGTCSGGCGTVFRLKPGRSGYTESVLYSFKDYTDGNQPFAALTVDESTGDLYGTTQYGGAKTVGTVFKLTKSGSSYVESILHSFDCGGYGNPFGCLPEAQLLLRSDGTLYGTNVLGGGGCNGIGCGSVFQLTPSQSGYSFQYVYNFGDPINGAEPEFGGLISDANGVLYGTTRSGGSKTDCYDGGPGGALGCGVVFTLTP
jgi:uncharacterized repeat protein (TIGR03803 family)